jgi:hypothetical protein
MAYWAYDIEIRPRFVIKLSEKQAHSENRLRLYMLRKAKRHPQNWGPPPPPVPYEELILGITGKKSTFHWY